MRDTYQYHGKLYDFFSYKKAKGAQNGSCRRGPQVSCPPLQRGDEVIEMVPKRLPLYHPIAKLPGAAGKDNFMCVPLGKGLL